MKLISKEITITELKEMSEKMFGNLVKAVVDIEKEVMVVDAGLHSDEESFLLEEGSQQENLWGINLYPDIEIQDENFIEFDSMINLRPSAKNYTRSIESEDIKKKIVVIVKNLVING